MLKNKKLIFLAIIVVLAAFFMFKGSLFFDRANKEGEQKGQNEEDYRKIKIVMIKDLEDVEMLLGMAQDKGFFKKNKIEIERIDTLGAATKTLVAEEADVYLGGLSGSLGAYLNGAETRWVGTPFLMFTQYGVSRFPEAEYGKIKKVGVNGIGVEPHLIAIIALKNMGVDVEKVDFLITKGNPEKSAMLEKGEIDFATIAPFEYLKESGMDKKYEVMDPGKMLRDSEMFRGIVTTKNILEKNGKGVEGFVTAISETLEYMSTNPDETKKYLQEKFGYSAERSEDLYGQFLESRKDIDFVPKKENIGKLSDLVIRYFKPEKPERSIDDFVVADIAQKAIEGVK